MLIVRTTAMITTTLLLAAPLQADNRPDHFEGKPAHTLNEARANLSEYNRKLEALLSRSELSTSDLHEIHVLTYTLENALEKIDSSVKTLVETLEAVHVASENADTATVKEKGKVYLRLARELSY